MEASSRQAVAAQLDKGLLRPWERAGRWCESKILLSLCSCMLHCPLTSRLASCLQDSWAMPGSCWEQEGDRAVPSSSQAIPAAHASWGWVRGCCGLLPVAVGLMARSCSGSCSHLGCHREEDNKGWMGFPCFSWGLCLDLEKLGWFLLLPHILFFLALSWEEQVLVSQSFSLSQPTIQQGKGFQPGKAAAAFLIFPAFSPAASLGWAGIHRDPPRHSTAKLGIISCSSGNREWQQDRISEGMPWGKEHGDGGCPGSAAGQQHRECFKTR